MEDVSTTLASVAAAVELNCQEAMGLLIAAFFVSFLLAFGIGANDVANSFGTSVGSKVLTLTGACFLATIMEISGAVLLGHKVSDTIRKGIVDLNEYQETPKEYMLGNLAALGGSAIWLLAATFLKMPISGTHSIVGSVLGFSLVARGLHGINWATLGKIVGSWFISPVLSGLVSGAIFHLIRRFILRKSDPIGPGLISLPIFYGLTIFINTISIMLDGPEALKISIESLPQWTEVLFGFLVSMVIAILVAILIAIFFVPRLRRAIREMLGSTARDASPLPATTVVLNNINDLLNYNNELNHNNTHLVKKYLQEPETIPMDGITPNGSGVPLIIETDCKQPNGHGPIAYDYEFEGGITFGPHLPSSSGSDMSADECDDRPGVGKLFSFLQIMTAAFGSFAHGGNDVSNAIGPLIALYLVYKEGRIESEAATPIWLLIFGGVGISIGLWVWGRRVIKTMGEDLTKITPSSGFTIEIGSAMTVLIASKIGIPVSTTHCKVGSVVFVGWLRSSTGGVDWALFRNIIFAWVVTLPISAGLSALLMWILRSFAL